MKQRPNKSGATLYPLEQDRAEDVFECDKSTQIWQLFFGP